MELLELGVTYRVRVPHKYTTLPLPLKHNHKHIPLHRAQSQGNYTYIPNPIPNPTPIPIPRTATHNLYLSNRSYVGSLQEGLNTRAGDGGRGRDVTREEMSRDLEKELQVRGGEENRVTINCRNHSWVIVFFFS